MYEFSFSNIFFFEGCGYRLNLHVLTHSFPTRRSSYLDVRAIASSISPALFVEKVRVEVTEPARTGLVVGDDLGAMIDEAASDPDLIDALSRDLERFMLAASTSLGDPDEGELRLAAARGDWSGVDRKSTRLNSSH